MEIVHNKAAAWSIAGKHGSGGVRGNKPDMGADPPAVVHVTQPRTSAADLLHHTAVPTEGYYKTVIHEKREQLARPQHGRQEVGQAPKAPYTIQAEFDPSKNRSFPGFGLPSRTGARLELTQFHVLANERPDSRTGGNVEAQGVVSARRHAQRAGQDSEAIKLGVFGGGVPFTRIGKLSTAVQRHMDPAACDSAAHSALRVQRPNAVAELLRRGPSNEPAACALAAVPRSGAEKASPPILPVKAEAGAPSPRSDSGAILPVAASSSAGGIIYGCAADQRNDLFSVQLDKERLKRLLLRCSDETNKFGEVVQRPQVFERVWNEAKRIEAAEGNHTARGGRRAEDHLGLTSVNSFRQALLVLKV
jgi:hypothetical protein